MIQLDDLTYNEFLTSNKRDEYIFAARYAIPYTKAIDIYNVGDIHEKTWGFVKDVQFELEQNQMSWEKMIDFIIEVTGKDGKEIGKEKFKDVCNFRMHLIEGIKELMNIEAHILSHTPTEKEKEAGIGLFENLGIFIQTDSLANGCIEKHRAIRKEPYSLCLTKLVLMKQMKTFNDNLIKINSNSYNSNN